MSDEARATYEGQLRHLMLQTFGTADFYSHHLRARGHDASDVIHDIGELQETWARENGLRHGTPIREIALEQARRARPDVLYLQNVGWFDSDELAFLRRQCGLLVGQCSYQPPPLEDLRAFDLIVTSFPRQLNEWRAFGLRVERLKIGFDPVAIKRVGVPYGRDFPLTFVGGVSVKHEWANGVLEEIAGAFPGVFQWWGYMQPGCAGPALRASYRGEAWGLDMYRILLRSQVTINRHGEIAWPFCNNMRLFEATGCGACLLTDHRDNIREFFEPNEVATYSNAASAIETIKFLLADDLKRECMAEAGRIRTLADHTYENRIEDLLAIIAGCKR